jgi:hypothetical protein
MYKRIMMGSAILLMAFIAISSAVDETDPQNANAAPRSAYSLWFDKFVYEVRRSPTFVELRASRNALESPQERITTVWVNLRGWADFAANNIWHDVLTVLREDVARNVRIEIWVRSPMLDTVVIQDTILKGDEETDPITRPPDNPNTAWIFEDFVEVELMFDLK